MVLLPLKINVPFTYQYEASGIGDTACHERVWYSRAFKVKPNKRALLCFNGNDYISDVWVNGKHATTQTGGFAPFSCEITAYLNGEENVLVVRCYDSLETAVPLVNGLLRADRISKFDLANFKKLIEKII